MPRQPGQLPDGETRGLQFTVCGISCLGLNGGPEFKFPDRFGGIEDARAFCQRFFPWYNTKHHHAGLGLLTPAVVHHGNAGPVRTERQAVLTAAYAAHPERFVHKPPTPPALPAAVWINAPGPTTLTLEAQQ